MLKAANIEDLENKDIKKLLWQYALPAIVATTVNALYNVIDRLFIGHTPDLGDSGLEAIGIALPIMTLITAFGMLIGAGSASRISISIGKGDKQTAEKILGNAFLLSLFLTLPASIILLLFLDPLVGALTEDATTTIYTKEFLSVFLPGSIFSTMCFGFNNMMRASGYPQKAMITMIISVVANIILAPIFLFQFKWGMKGAALATVISMIIGLAFVMHHFLNRSSMLRLSRKNIKWDLTIVKAIVSIGLSPFFIQLVNSSVVFLVIRCLQTYGGKEAVGAYTISNTLIMLLVMSIIGLTQGMQPIVGYNYGANRMKRVRETLVYTIKVGMSIGALGLIIGLFLPDLAVRPFNPESETLALEAIKALRLMVCMLPLVGFQIVVTNFFQSIGKAKISIALSLSRQFFILIPALYIMPIFLGVNGVWGAMPASDFLSTIITAGVFFWHLHQFKKADESQLL